MKFTMSKDGIERANMYVPIRLSKADIEEIKRIARKDKTPWKQWVKEQAESGVFGACVRFNDVENA